MKILLFDTTYAFLTPGGKTTHALKLQKELSILGINIQFSSWWDKSQEDCDIIHFLTPIPQIAKLAKEKGIKTFLSLIFDFESSKSKIEQSKAMIKNKLIEKLPGTLSAGAYWKAFPYMDKVQFMHEYDRRAALKYFPHHLKREQTLIIPHAFDPQEMNISNEINIKEMNFPEKYLVSCANISERKQSVLLAKYAKLAKVPIVFIGNSLLSDPYLKDFKAQIDNEYVYYPGYVSREWKDCIESHASGYVLLSKGESGCIAVYEAAAYNIPILLSNRPWAWGYDSPTDIHFCDYQQKEKAVHQLSDFFKKSGKLKHPPFNIYTWEEVAKKYAEIYRMLLA